ncbi:MAG: hypothetical protein A2275_13650 [Bacteroidetes bacterium RIFOXYA12_FULL_35_11]|nr:MAG: hypothetical protein A2X01_01110 [Bacteroidetes bacterium GWF2_35_48]OFY74244.1 MAG: hypothetical protein A2275_13650 [Bacteroidetes bacterium RIFOXYA12_FULL_35_11]HBX51176.1 hypothetical protein [Bacteroidales bacterium]
MYSKDDLLCFNILESVKKILDISNQYSSIEELASNYIPYDAVLMNFIVIGEIAGKLSDEFKDKYSQIDWYKIHGFRNMIAHDYFGIDDKVVWQIIQTKLPELKKILDINLNLA